MSVLCGACGHIAPDPDFAVCVSCAHKSAQDEASRCLEGMRRRLCDAAGMPDDTSWDALASMLAEAKRRQT